MMVLSALFLVLVFLVITNRIAGQTYVAKALLALDLFACALLTREFDLTISATCGLKWRGNPSFGWHALHELLNALQKDHCELALIGDLARAQTVVKLLSLPSA